MLSDKDDTEVIEAFSICNIKVSSTVTISTEEELIFKVATSNIEEPVNDDVVSELTRLIADAHGRRVGKKIVRKGRRVGKKICVIGTYLLVKVLTKMEGSYIEEYVILIIYTIGNFDNL